MCGLASFTNMSAICSLHVVSFVPPVLYLETETEDNVGFYQHLGFEVIEQVTAVGLDLPVWLMLRPPHPVGM